VDAEIPMQDVASLAGIVAALAVGVVSPGPSFVMVARTAVAGSRAQGVAAALGMGVGGVVFAAAALLGLQAVLLAVPGLYLALKVLGGLYLCYLGTLIFRGADAALPTPNASGPAGGRRRSLLLGLTTQLSNPKTAIVYASVFVAFLPAHCSAAFAAALLAAVLAIEAGWYAIVALLLSSPLPRRTYLACKGWIDRTAGLVLCGLGLRLVATAPVA
jgi:threonine/homoserine/homoserine lactone efflux protein